LESETHINHTKRDKHTFDEAAVISMLDL